MIGADLAINQLQKSTIQLLIAFVACFTIFTLIVIAVKRRSAQVQPLKKAVRDAYREALLTMKPLLLRETR